MPFPCSLEEALGESAWSPSTKSQVSIKSLSDVEVILVYIGGVWCHPCHGYKDHLKTLYKKANNETDKKKLEIIFCQSRGPRPDIQNISEAEWDKYMEDMPWLILDKEKSAPVHQRFTSSSVPHSLVLKRDPKDPKTLTATWDVTNFIRDFREDSWPLTSEHYDSTQGFYDELIMWPGSYLGKDYEPSKVYGRGSLEKIKKILEKNPRLVSQPAPQSWTNDFFVPGGWKPVDIYPGIFSHDEEIRVDSNAPIYPLHLAAGSGYDDVVEFFLQQKAVDIEVADGDGSTPLTWAAFTYRPKCIELLLSKGADVSSVLNISRATWLSIRGAPEGYDMVANHKS